MQCPNIDLDLRSNLVVVACCWTFRLIASAALLACGSLTLSADDVISFRRDIAPILLENCVACHGPKKAEGGYRLDSFAQFARPGDSGIEPLAALAEHISELVRRLKTEDVSERMPAERSALSAEAIGLVERWQRQGAKYDGDNPQQNLLDLVPVATYPAAPTVYSAAIPITAIVFSPDGSELITGGYHELTIWDATTGALKRRIGNMPQRILALDWNADGTRLAVAGGTPGRIGEVRIVDWANSKMVLSLGRVGEIIQSVRFQPAGKLIATANSDGTVRWFDAAQGQMVRSAASHADIVTAIDWSHDGKRIVSGSRDKTAKVLDIESGELIATYSAHGEPVTGVCFNEGDGEVTSSGADKKIHRWKVEDGKRTGQLATPASPTRLSVVAPSLWYGASDNVVRKVELATTKQQSELKGHTAWVTALSAHPATKRLASGAINGEVRLWDLETGKELHHWQAIPGEGSHAAN